MLLFSLVMLSSKVLQIIAQLRMAILIDLGYHALVSAGPGDGTEIFIQR